MKHLNTSGADLELADEETEYTALHLASEQGAPRWPLWAVKDLVEAGANVEALEKKGRTPLHRAVLRNFLDTMDFLLKSGANPNAKDPKGAAPMRGAVLKQDTGALAMLIEHGADVNSTNPAPRRYQRKTGAHGTALFKRRSGSERNPRDGLHAGVRRSLLRSAGCLGETFPRGRQLQP